LDGYVELYTSKEIIEELAQVLRKERISKIFHAKKLEPLIFLQFYLSQCKSINADYLISVDYDLLDIKTFGKTKILRPGEFLKEINQ